VIALHPSSLRKTPQRLAKGLQHLIQAPGGLFQSFPPPTPAYLDINLNIVVGTPASTAGAVLDGVPPAAKLGLGDLPPKECDIHITPKQYSNYFGEY
jgi:hypothetical protein